jgi:hypothetical protein
MGVTSSSEAGITLQIYHMIKRIGGPLQCKPEARAIPIIKVTISRFIVHNKTHHPGGILYQGSECLAHDSFLT